MKKYGYIWVSLVLFLGSLIGHWIFGWYAYQNEQRERNLPVETSDYLVEVGRDTLENWQSEFLQLIWQVAGLGFLLCVGSPQSKEGDDRREEKLDIILKLLEPQKADYIIRSLKDKYDK